MNFKTVAEAFNFYRNKTVEELEKRTKEISDIIDKDANADINALNIELKGIKEARENMETRSQAKNTLNLITGMSTNRKTFGDDAVDTPEYRSAFFKTLLGKPLTDVEKSAFEAAHNEKRADSFTASTDAVAVLPTSTLNEIVKKARTQGGLLGECRAFAMPTKIAIPVGTPGDKAAWHKEGAEVTPDKPVTANVIFDGYEIMKVFSISAKARKMSISAFESYLVQELTDCVMACIADSLVNGDGNEQGTGLIPGITWNADNSIEVTAKNGITYKDIVKTIALLKRGYAAGAKFAMNNATLYTDIYGLVDANGRPVFIADPKNESVGKILGFEVVIDDNLPADTLVLGNFAQYLGYNMPEGIVIETSRESSFRKGLIDYRAMAIADTKPIVPEAFVKLSVAAVAA